MTWTRLEWNEDPFERDTPVGVDNVVVAAPRDVAVPFLNDHYGTDVDRVSGDTKAWTITEKRDPDVFARFILDEVEFGGVGQGRTRPATLADMVGSDRVAVFGPDEVSNWAKEEGVDAETPSHPWVPEHAVGPGSDVRGSEFVPDDPHEEDEERSERGRNS